MEYVISKIISYKIIPLLRKDKMNIFLVKIVYI